MEIKALSDETKKTEYTIFGELKNGGFNEGEWEYIKKDILFKISESIISISSSLRHYFVVKLELPHSSKALEEEFGKDWKLLINLKGETKIDDTDKIVCISYEKFKLFIEKDAEKAAQDLVRGLAKERKSKTTTRDSTKENSSRILSNEKFHDFVKNTDNAENFINNIIISRDKNITNNITKSQKNRVKKDAEKLFKRENLSEKQIQTFIMENKSILFSEGIYVGEGDKFSNIFGKKQNRSFLDILLITKYGVAKIIELKRHKCHVLTYDKNHEKFVPTKETSSAISQLNNYLRIVARNENGEANTIGIKPGYEPFSEGLLIIGSNDNLYNKDVKSLKGLTEEEAKEKARAELISLSFNQKNIRITTYDDFINLATEWKDGDESEI